MLRTEGGGRTGEDPQDDMVSTSEGMPRSGERVFPEDGHGDSVRALCVRCCVDTVLGDRVVLESGWEDRDEPWSEEDELEDEVELELELEDRDEPWSGRGARCGDLDRGVRVCEEGRWSGLRDREEDDLLRLGREERAGRDDGGGPKRSKTLVTGCSSVTLTSR
jgi:hypothetical protein